MLNFIIRRTLYSALVIIGVLMLTFVFFRVSAGDPAAALLGKNPSPIEIENLRNELSADKPVFFGHWRKTESFTSANFAKKLDYPGVDVPLESVPGKGFIRLESGRIVFRKNFTASGTGTLMAKVSFRGRFECGGKSYKSLEWTNDEIIFQADSDSLSLSISKSSDFADFRSVEFFKRQDSPYESQIFSALNEIVSFRKEFPYVRFFNFGKTLVTREEIGTVLSKGIMPSLLLMVPIFIGEILFGTVLALISTAYRGRWPDKLIVLFSVAGMSVSYLVFIIAGQWYLGYYFNWFPVWGYGSLKFFILPVIVGILSGVGEGVRFYRTVFINELNKEYLRTAAAKGCSPLSIYCKHLFANAAIPLITRATAILPFLFTGSLLLESFFGIPGLGYAGINAVMNADLQMVKALVVVTAMLFVAINLFADIAYAWADPRVRLK